MSSPITPAGGNWSAEAARLRQAGYSMSRNPVMARLEAARVAESVGRGSLTDMANRKMTADMNRRRLASQRGATAGMIHTASDLQMALPKIRQPLSSLMDKGIPFNINDPKELIELRRWCRLFYSTHDLVPLLVDIYSKFPVTGLELQSKDPLIEKFYTQMFLDDLNYEEFLPDAIGREYFIAGEVTTLSHFSEELGVWSSEEVLNPDMVAVSKSLFVEEERVQLLVKELVDVLRSGPQGRPDTQERPSERLERTFEYQQLAKYYPEIIQAAGRDDGLDIADALVSRLVNRAAPWDLRGTPPLLRSFRTLLMEEELNAAQDAVAGRLYAPMVLCTMGIENMGNDEPWIPGQGELDDLRDDMQSALAADFKLLVHNFGVKVESVFGRESVPDFGNDYDRIDAKLMQAWGIGQALIMGGTGAGGAYASSALNREVCEQLMMGFQKKVVRHMRKKMEIIAEAQEHYDYEIKGSLRVPLYREIVKDIVDDEGQPTGEKRIVRVPKLLIPEVHFATLNLRDENQERMFIMQLKQAGVPVSDKSLAINIEVDFEQELERGAQETVDKAMAKAQAWKVVQDKCDVEGLPYPEELVVHLTATLQLRQQLAATKMAEDQQKMADQQATQASPAGQVGAAPGTSPMPGAPGADMMGAAPPDATQGDDQTSQSSPPTASAPGGAEMSDPSGAGASAGAEPARNRQRPPESDEQRANAPRAASAAERWAARVNGQPVPNFVRAHPPRTAGPRKGKPRPSTMNSKIVRGPSSVGAVLHASEEQVQAAIRRREMWARHRGTPLVSQLVKDPDFYKMCHAQADAGMIKADYAEIRAGGARESAKLLHDLVDQYEEITGRAPIWD
jgi:hypothetical protein